MSTMSDKRILDAKARGHIVIDPYNEPNLATSSYDITLGENFYREQHPEFASNIFNMYDAEHVSRVWGSCKEAPLAKDVLPFHFFDKPSNQRVITEDDKVIMMAPGETILGHTEQYIGGRIDITTMMKARSSLGRCFISVCHDAGWGDVGYINRWTLEITNKSQHYNVPLLVGSRIGQLVFMETGEILDKDYSKTGNYQKSNDLKVLKATWIPESMLPKVRR